MKTDELALVVKWDKDLRVLDKLGLDKVQLYKTDKLA